MVASTMAISASESKMENDFPRNSKMSVIANLFIMIGIILRQASGTKSGLKWVIHLTMILTLAVYETYFTSMVVVPIKIEDNPGFVSLLKSGYRIGSYREVGNGSIGINNSHNKFLNIYAYDFKKLGIIGWINNRKYFYHVRNLNEKKEAMYNQSLKVMMDASHHSDNREWVNSILEMDNSHGNMTCKLVPEIFLRTHSYDLIHISVRVEVLALLGSIREGGLTNFWMRTWSNLLIRKNERITRMVLRRRRIFVDETEILRWADLIRLNNFGSLFLICGGCLGIAVAVFIGEKCVINIMWNKHNCANIYTSK
ncbi:hypothetical protein Fcan01_16457 [Folsomia candida]|uniref:Uncharacterized protein n=1 Tax=Folsomia candida TaxID=158441 RepID=A0A226DVX5_FOLCA|nr:hypothetical protein Fcan01_16457 [Folsomia candida]